MHFLNEKLGVKLTKVKFVSNLDHFYLVPYVTFYMLKSKPVHFRKKFFIPQLHNGPRKAPLAKFWPALEGKKV